MGYLPNPSVSIFHKCLSLVLGGTTFYVRHIKHPEVYPLIPREVRQIPICHP